MRRKKPQHFFVVYNFSSHAFEIDAKSAQKKNRTRNTNFRWFGAECVANNNNKSERLLETICSQSLSLVIVVFHLSLLNSISVSVFNWSTGQTVHSTSRNGQKRKAEREKKYDWEEWRAYGFFFIMHISLFKIFHQFRLARSSYSASFHSRHFFLPFDLFFICDERVHIRMFYLLHKIIANKTKQK